jgi:YD repeat-containing protein
VALNKANRLLQAGETTYTWDAAGNLIAQQTEEGERSYQYDAANRLVTVTEADGSGVTYGYDARIPVLARIMRRRTHRATTLSQGSGAAPRGS